MPASPISRIHLKNLVSSCLLLGSPLHATDRPNIIFVLTDDQRRDSLPCYGNSFVKTPEIDRLAKEGIVFDRASVTSAICTPSRACYFLGQFERRHGINFNSGTSMSEEAWSQSYPLILRENGYYTGYVGKNHVPIGADGYETGLMEHSFDYWYAGHGHISFYPKKAHEIFKGNPADTQVEVVTEGALSFLENKGSYLEGALSFLNSRPNDKPFCLSICLNVPHGAGTGSMRMLPEDDELYRLTYRDRMEEMPLPPHYLEKEAIQSPKLPPEVLHTQFRQAGYNVVDQESTLRERMVREYQTITGIDRMLGRIRKMLDEQSLADNTIIIITSDHGLLHGDHGLGGKALNYETCLAVPLLALDPRVPAAQRGIRSGELVQSIDLAPTLLDIASVAPPSSMQGKSYLRLIQGMPAPDWRTFAFAENLWSTIFGNPRIESIRSKRWKYLRYFENDRIHWAGITKKDQYRVTSRQRDLYREWLDASIEGEAPVYEELFDLHKDPHESLNLIDQSEHQEIAEILRNECRKMVAVARGPLGRHPATTPLSLESKPR